MSVSLDAQQAPDSLIRSIEGKDLFAAYCASCHGMDAKGGGPASAAMKTRPPDLTLINKRYRGSFPKAKIEGIVSGGKDVMKRAHGSSEMPVWGPVFHQVERDQDLGHVRLKNVVNYLESIQRTGK